MFPFSIGKKVTLRKTGEELRSHLRAYYKEKESYGCTDTGNGFVIQRNADALNANIIQRFPLTIKGVIEKTGVQERLKLKVSSASNLALFLASIAMVAIYLLLFGSFNTSVDVVVLLLIVVMNVYFGYLSLFVPLRDLLLTLGGDGFV
jgi:hypothetical protein